MEQLPLETLMSICEYVTAEHSPSLFAFALSSQRCRDATNRYRFQSIRLRFQTREKFTEDLNYWNKALLRNSSFRCVNELRVEGTMPPANNVDEDVEHYGKWMRFDCQPPHLVQQEDEAWKPLANLMLQLPSLRDFIFACTNQLPPCLLETLHTRLPECRLHLHPFFLRSLVQNWSGPYDIDPYEYQIATSPALYSVKVPAGPLWKMTTLGRARIRTPGNFLPTDQLSYNRDACLQMVTGLAPGLRKLKLYGDDPFARMLGETTWGRLRPPWQGSLQKQTSTPTRHGWLEELSLLNYASIRPDDIRLWAQQTPFSRLRTLVITLVESGVIVDAIEALRSHEFASLQRLELDMCDYDANMPFDNALGELFWSLRPLQHIRLSGYFTEKTFETILERHGASLRSLSLLPGMEFEPDQVKVLAIVRGEIMSIQRSCPKIEHLTLRVPRTKGSLDEVAIYEGLAQMRRTRLRMAFLAVMLMCKKP